MSKFLFCILSAAMIFSTVAQAETAVSEIVALRRQNRARFDQAGKYMNDAVKREAFLMAQNALIRKYRAEGKASRSIRITNDAPLYRNRIVTVTIIQENGTFVALYVERNKYENKDDEAGLRFYDIPLLVRGMTLFSANGTSLVAFDSEVMTPELGGEVAIKYPTDIKKNRTSQVSFLVLKSVTGDFAFYKTDRKPFSSIDLDIRVNVLNSLMGNIDGGIKRVKFL